MTASLSVGAAVCSDVSSVESLEFDVPCDLLSECTSGSGVWGWIRWEPCACDGETGELRLYCKEDWFGFYVDEEGGRSSVQQATCGTCDGDVEAIVSGAL